MMTTKMMIGMIVLYLVIFITALAEEKYPAALYWLGAAILTTGVLLGAGQ